MRTLVLVYALMLLALCGVAPALAQAGSIVAWGNNAQGQCNVPAPAADFAAVVGGGSHRPDLKSRIDGAAGACCLSSGTCESVSESQCSQHNGSYQRDGTSCDPNPCPLRVALPDPQHCTVTPLLGPPTMPSQQVAFLAPGNLNGTAITITVRDQANAPISGATVVVLFNSAVKICATAVHIGTTGATGVCTVALRGGGCLTGVVGACVIVANGIEIKSLRNVRSPDNNSHAISFPDGRVNVADLAFFGDEYKGVAPPGCHDYDNNLLCDLTDLTYFGDAFMKGLYCTLNP